MSLLFCIEYSNEINYMRPQGNKVASASFSTSRAPKSPWMPFPMLFAAISNKVPPKDMELINVYYEQFRVR